MSLRNRRRAKRRLFRHWTRIERRWFRSPTEFGRMVAEEMAVLTQADRVYWQRKLGRL